MRSKAYLQWYGPVIRSGEKAIYVLISSQVSRPPRKSIRPLVLCAIHYDLSMLSLLRRGSRRTSSHISKVSSNCPQDRPEHAESLHTSATLQVDIIVVLERQYSLPQTPSARISTAPVAYYVDTAMVRPATESQRTARGTTNAVYCPWRGTAEKMGSEAATKDPTLGRQAREQP